MALMLAGLWLVLAVHPDTRDAFATATNLRNLTAQVAEIVVLGVGMTLVLLLGGIDLSVGAGMALAGVIAAKLQMDFAQAAWVACLAALLAGTALGVWHGVLVGMLRVPPFVATLSGFLAYRGLALVIADARGLSPMGDDFLKLGGLLSAEVARGLFLLGGSAALLTEVRHAQRRKHFGLEPEALSTRGGRWLAIGLVTTFGFVVYADGLPVPVLLAMGTLVLGSIFLWRTRAGRYAMAMGSNSEAARLCGVPTRAMTVAIYGVLGTLTALAGIIATARTNGVTPGNAGMMRELHVVTAVVIGGTSLSGGRATMAGTALGALIFGTLSNGMNLMNVSSHWQLVLTGMILLFASLFDSMSSAKQG
jgi:D-xylose transport system permease protein